MVKLFNNFILGRSYRNKSDIKFFRNFVNISSNGLIIALKCSRNLKIEFSSVAEDAVLVVELIEILAFDYCCFLFVAGSDITCRLLFMSKFYI